MREPAWRWGLTKKPSLLVKEETRFPPVPEGPQFPHEEGYHLRKRASGGKGMRPGRTTGALRPRWIARRTLLAGVLAYRQSGEGLGIGSGGDRARARE